MRQAHDAPGGSNCNATPGILASGSRHASCRRRRRLTPRCHIRTFPIHTRTQGSSCVYTSNSHSQRSNSSTSRRPHANTQHAHAQRPPHPRHHLRPTGGVRPKLRATVATSRVRNVLTRAQRTRNDSAESGSHGAWIRVRKSAYFYRCVRAFERTCCIWICMFVCAWIFMCARMCVLSALVCSLMSAYTGINKDGPGARAVRARVKLNTRKIRKCITLRVCVHTHTHTPKPLYVFDQCTHSLARSRILGNRII